MSDLTKRLRTPERTISRCRNLLYVSAETAVEAANEIDRLAAEVERLRMTQEEHDALDEARRLGDQWGWSETIRLLQQRHSRETVGG